MKYKLVKNNLNAEVKPKTPFFSSLASLFNEVYNDIENLFDINKLHKLLVETPRKHSVSAKDLRKREEFFNNK